VFKTSGEKSPELWRQKKPSDILEGFQVLGV